MHTRKYWTTGSIYNMAELYRHSVPSAGVSLERNTESVPNDDKFYLLRNGEVVGVFTSMKRGESRFRELLTQIGHIPTPINTDTAADPAKVEIERYLDAKEEFWGSSYLYRSRSGRLSNR